MHYQFLPDRHLCKHLASPRQHEPVTTVRLAAGSVPLVAVPADPEHAFGARHEPVPMVKLKSEVPFDVEHALVPSHEPSPTMEYHISLQASGRTTDSQS
jgi:hypothetical protein